MIIAINKFERLIAKAKEREATCRDVIMSNREFVESFVTGKETLTPLAVKQVYQHHGIPITFANKLNSLGLNSSTNNLISDIAGEIPDTLRMIRYQGNGADKVVRAFLSNSYERIDNNEVITAIQDSQLEDLGLTLQTANITDTQLHLSYVSERLEREVGTQTGDILQFGISLFNSEVGRSSFRIVPFVYRLVCKNGLIVATNDGMGSYRVFHLGKKLETGELLPASAVTSADRRINPEVIRAKVRELLSSEGVQSVMDKIAEKATQTINAPTSRIVANLRKEVVLTNREANLVEEYINNSDVKGPTTVYSVMNALTKVAHFSEDYDRNIELQQLGWRIVTTTGAKTYERPVKDAA